MEKIYAPWRMEFIKGEKQAGCVFCKDSARCHDLVLYEGKSAFVMMNRYPYNSGHLMIVPFRHICEMEDLLPEEKREVFDLLDESIKILKEAMSPEGFNVGINLGKAAGAGIVDHMHVHIVPRWSGDTNFITTVGDIRVVPEDIHKTCALLIPYFKKYRPEV